MKMDILEANHEEMLVRDFFVPKCIILKYSKPFYVNPFGLLSNAMEKDRIIRAFFPDALGIQYRIYAFFFSVFSTHDAHPYGFKTIAHDS